MMWEKVRLSEIVDTSSGGTPNRSIKEYWENGDIPWIKSGQLKDCLIEGAEEFITEQGLKSSSAKLVDKGTLLLALYGATAGKLGFLGLNATTNQAICAIKPKKDNLINSKYLYYYLLSQRSEIIKDSEGGAQPNISQNYVNNIQIPLPPLPIQKRIAEILDTADALRRKDEALLKKYDELAQAIFIDMFGDPVKNEKGWEVKKLGEVCDKITDGTHFSPPNIPSGIPYITAKHLRKNQINFYDNPTYISQEHHQEIFSRCKPMKGDVLYIKDGATTGISAVNEYDFEFSMLSSLALIKPSKSLLNSYYLSCFLNNEIVKKELILTYMSGAAIKRFTLDKINKFKIVIPPIESQNLFEKKWKILQQNVEILKTNKSTNLFNSLLQKAFNGELVA